MRNPERLDSFYDEIKQIHKTHFSDWRFGQLIMNVLGDMSMEGRDPFFPEEDEMLAFFRKYAEQHSPYNNWKAEDFKKNAGNH